MKAAYQWLARLIALGVVLQAAFIAFGMFGVEHEADDGKAFTADTANNLGQSLHSIVGSIIPLIALVLLIVSFFAKARGGVRFAAIVLGLAVLQVLLATVSSSVPAIGLLHGINAFALAAVAGMAGSRAGSGAETRAAA